MAKTVVGLFDNFTEAQNVVQELVNAGFERNDVSLVANDARGEYSRAVGDTSESSTGEGAAAGAIGGGVLGGVLGLLVGVGALAIPGIGPVLAAGPLAAALGAAGASTVVGAGIGAAAGGVIGALVGAGIPEEDASFYAEGIRRGGTLVMVKSSDEMANRAYDVMQRYGAVDVDKRSGEYRSTGWNRFDDAAEPYSGDADDKWSRSSKVGTTGGAVAGAATGAAIGSVAGPVGTVIGGVAGAATGAGVGAAGDIAGETVEEGDYDTTTTSRDYDTTGRDYRSTGGDRETPGRGDTIGDQWSESSKVGTAGGTAAGAATGAAIGSVGGPVGTVVGGLAGAAAGAATGAAGDVAGESAEDHFTRYDNDYRTHYQGYGTSSGYSYEQYQPVYRYGYGLANDPTYRDYDWDRLEPEARSRWEERNPGTWDRFKDSVRYAWERAKNTVS
jgi:hypothetical protein